MTYWSHGHNTHNIIYYSKSLKLLAQQTMSLWPYISGAIKTKHKNTYHPKYLRPIPKNYWLISYDCHCILYAWYHIYSVCHIMFVIIYHMLLPHSMFVTNYIFVIMYICVIISHVYAKKTEDINWCLIINCSKFAI